MCGFLKKGGLKHIKGPIILKIKKTSLHFMLYLILCFIALFAIGPFLWMLIVSVTTKGDLFALPHIFLKDAFFEIFKCVKDIFNIGNKAGLNEISCISNFKEVWNAVPMLQFLINSSVISIFGILLNLTIASLAAYPLARLDFPGRNLILYGILATLMLPEEANLIVNFVTCGWLGLLDTLPGVFLPSAASVFGIFLMRQAYLTIPKELEDAARLDGANDLQIWAKIMLPLTSPAMATLAIFSFVAYWNTFLWPLIILQSPEKFPLAVGLSWLSGTFTSKFRVVAAGSVIAVLPIIIVFLALQRYFMKGMAQGAIK